MNMLDTITKTLDLRTFEQIKEDASLASCFAVSDLAQHSIGAVGRAIADLTESLGLINTPSRVIVDRRLASLWFGFSIKPKGWQLPPIWDSIAGDYKTQDGWVRLHTNLPHHKRAALSVLETPENREQVSQAVSQMDSEQLEKSIVESGGVAAAMRTQNQWRKHPQGIALASEPLVAWSNERKIEMRDWQGSLAKPLQGLRVLDLTRVLAGPVATRVLAGFGAQVLRIDPPEWDEGNIVPDITLGKRAAMLQLKLASDRQIFTELLAQTDVLVHGYRPGALDNLGFDKATRKSIAPKLLEVSIDAYGFSGPWAERRGFDSLVQMSCGIADAGMKWANSKKPHPLPLQALDHATGYLMAAAIIKSLEKAKQFSIAQNAQLSLARTAQLLMQYPQTDGQIMSIDASQKDYSDAIENTPWGQAYRLKSALNVEHSPMVWDLPACSLGSGKAYWL